MTMKRMRIIPNPQMTMSVQMDIEDYELENALEDLMTEIRDLQEARLLLKILPVIREFIRK